MAPDKVLVSVDMNRTLTGQSIPHRKSWFQDRPFETLMVLRLHLGVHFTFKI